MALSVGVVLGSVRQGRRALQVGQWVAKVAAARPSLEVTLLDLKDWPLPFYALPEVPKLAEAHYADPLAKSWVETVGRQDGFLVVTPEYNHGYPAVLKNALDYCYAGWNHKPMGFVSYGGSSGGVRAVQQLRQVAVELQALPLRDEVNIPFVARALADDGTPREPHHGKRLERLLDQLEWWAEATRQARERRAPPG